MIVFKNAVLKWLAIGFIIFILTTLTISFVLNIAVYLMHKKEFIFEVGNSVESVGSYFTFIRLSIVVFIIFYWNELVRWIGRWQKLNYRQVFFLKKVHPYVAGILILLEIFGLVF